MEEAVEGTEGLCGGIFIDDAFERIVRSRLGRRWEYISQNGIKEILRGSGKKESSANTSRRMPVESILSAFLQRHLYRQASTTPPESHISRKEEFISRGRYPGGLHRVFLWH